MPVYRARTMPVVTVHRDTLLNTKLSSISRLLYAVLLASVDDDDVTMKDVAALVGVQDIGELRPYLDELIEAGVVEYADHHGQGRVVTVHQLPLLPEQRSHVCVPCEECGDCSCGYLKGLCRTCDGICRVEASAEQDIARWKQQLEGGATYAIGQHAARLHRWDCPTLNSPEKSMAQLAAARPHARNGGFYWPRLPYLFTAEELRQKNSKKRRCAICGPDPL